MKETNDDSVVHSYQMSNKVRCMPLTAAFKDRSEAIAALFAVG